MIPIFILYDQNMNEIDYPEGITPLDIFVSSIEKERVTESLEGKSGSIDYGAIYKERPIELKFLLKANDTQSYRLLRDELYAVIDEIEYVSETYQIGKRYNVKVDTSFIPERYENNQRFAEAEVSCITTELPFAESIGTTQDIEHSRLRYSDELWSYGMGLSYEDNTKDYSHRQLNFSIFNAGNVSVHPFEQYLKIELENIGKGYRLINETTGDKFEYLGRTTGKFVLDGPNMTMKGLQAFRDTNRQYISLVPGWNYFNQNKAKEVKFDFRYYYK